jgi:hypothetical protein
MPLVAVMKEQQLRSCVPIMSTGHINIDIINLFFALRAYIMFNSLCAQDLAGEPTNGNKT